MKEIFRYERPSGVSLCETFSDNCFSFNLSLKGENKAILLYSLKKNEDGARNIYLGHTKEEVLDSGRDILAEALLLRDRR